MNPVASHLVRRVLAWQALFYMLGARQLAQLTPRHQL